MALRLVDPNLKQARRRDVVVLLVGILHLAYLHGHHEELVAMIIWGGGDRSGNADRSCTSEGFWFEIQSEHVGKQVLEGSTDAAGSAVPGSSTKRPIAHQARIVAQGEKAPDEDAIRRSTCKRDTDYHRHVATEQAMSDPNSVRLLVPPRRPVLAGAAVTATHAGFNPC